MTGFSKSRWLDSYKNLAKKKSLQNHQSDKNLQVPYSSMSYSLYRSSIAKQWLNMSKKNFFTLYLWPLGGASLSVVVKIQDIR